MAHRRRPRNGQSRPDLGDSGAIRIVDGKGHIGGGLLTGGAAGWTDSIDITMGRLSIGFYSISGPGAPTPISTRPRPRHRDIDPEDILFPFLLSTP